MGLALLFPGQGTQHAQMLPWLSDAPEAAPMVERLAAVLGRDWRGRLDDVDWATANAAAQPLVVGTSLAAWACLSARVPVPVVVAGYSVGELAAFSAAGVFDAATALDLSVRRAAAMDVAAGDAPGGLLAVRDMPAALLQGWIERHGLAMAIRLGVGRGIVGGPIAALDAAMADADVAAARLERLAIRIASHTPCVAAAVPEFARELAQHALRRPSCPIACNFTGQATRNPAELARALAGQVASTVLWDACLDSVAERGVRCVLEVGPGTTLSRMWRERFPEVPARSVDEFRSPSAVADWVTRQLA